MAQHMRAEQMPARSRTWLEAECLAVARRTTGGKDIQRVMIRRVNPKGAAEGDLVFASGHPHSTERLQTYAMLVYQRDGVFPYMLQRLKERRALLKRYSAMGPEQARRARTSGAEGGETDEEGEQRRRSCADAVALRLAVLAANDKGTVELILPTRRSLERLVSFQCVDEALTQLGRAP